MIAILERINQLANKAKEVGLTEIEKRSKWIFARNTFKSFGDLYKVFS